MTILIVITAVVVRDNDNYNYYDSNTDDNYRSDNDHNCDPPNNCYSNNNTHYYCDSLHTCNDSASLSCCKRLNFSLRTWLFSSSGLFSISLNKLLKVSHVSA